MVLTKSIIHAIMVAMNAKLSPDDMMVSFRVMGCLVPASTEQPVLFFYFTLTLYHIGNIMSSSYSQFHDFFWWNICL